MNQGICKKDLNQLASIMLADFKTIENLLVYWKTHSRREIDKYFKATYDCSYYYAKKLFTEIFLFEDRTKEEYLKIMTKNIQQTNLKRYGRTNVGQFGSEEYNRTIKEKYGVDNIAYLESTTKKKKQTCLSRYGYETNMQTKEFRSLSSKKYSYDGQTFDSSWELALYIYAKDHDEQIIREPQTFEYYYKEQKHYYTPDFLYKDTLIDIKGNQFIKNETLINPFNSDQNELYKAKYICIKTHNVKILTKKDIKFALDYISITYGQNFLKQYKNK